MNGAETGSKGLKSTWGIEALKWEQTLCLAEAGESVPPGAVCGCAGRVRCWKEQLMLFLKQQQHRVNNIIEPGWDAWGDDPAVLQDYEPCARWLWISFCSCNLFVTACKSDCQPVVSLAACHPHHCCQAFLRMHGKRASEPLCPMGSVASDTWFSEIHWSVQESCQCWPVEGFACCSVAAVREQGREWHGPAASCKSWSMVVFL